MRCTENTEPLYPHLLVLTTNKKQDLISSDGNNPMKSYNM